MKIKILIFSVCTIFSSLWASDTFIEVKGSYDYPASSDFRAIYSSGPMFGVEASMQAWRQLYTWASGSLMIRQGHSIGLNDPTRIAFYPIGLGIKYLFPVRFVDFYLGGGPLAVYMHLHDHAPNIVHKTCRWGGGGILKAGALLNCSKHWFFDVFTDYSFLYVPVAKSSERITRTADLSGWSIGLGFGYRFGEKR